MTTTEYDTSHDTGQAESELVRLLRKMVEKSEILQHRIQQLERQALSAPAEASDCAECPYHFGQGSSRSVH